MKTHKLVCDKRDLTLKVNKIRKNGFVPAVISGRYLDSLSIQIKQDLAIKFLQLNSVGSKVLLEIEGEEHLAIFKKFQRNTSNRSIIHLEFQALTSGENVKVTLPINYVNKDSLQQDAILQEQLNGIEISTLPKFLIEYVTIDLSKLKLGDSFLVSDLDISNDDNIEVLSPQDSQVCSIMHAPKFEETLPEDEEKNDEPDLITKTTEE